MNYTENYHLPQWDESDRILRTDFNQMCEDIENGLTETSTDTKNLRQSSGVQQKQTMDCLHRLAYNHFCAVQDMEPFPCQTGVFQQNFEKNSATLTGTSLLNGKHFTENFSAELTQEALVQSCQTVRQMHVVKNNLPACTQMWSTFTPPRSGIVDHYFLQGNYRESPSNASFRIRIRLVNQDTGGVEVSVVKTLTHANTSGAFSYWIDGAPLHFLGGAHYAITVDCLDAVCNMDAEISFARSDLKVNAFPSSQTPVTASASLHTPLGGRGGMAVLRFSTGGTGAELKFVWDGVEREPDIQRTVRLGSGWGCREFLYLRENSVPEDSAMSFRFICNPEGSVLLHDWGMILL